MCYTISTITVTSCRNCQCCTHALPRDTAPFFANTGPAREFFTGSRCQILTS